MAYHERLFFTMPASSELASTNNKFSELNTTMLVRNFFNFISGTFLDPRVPRLSPRKMRKYKSLGMHTAGDVAVRNGGNLESQLDGQSFDLFGGYS